MKTWWLDEREFAGAEHLDDAYVAAYELKAQFDPGPDLSLLVELGLGPGSSLVDLGAGPGTFAFAAAGIGASVTAVDVSPAMVAAMRDRAAQEPRLEVEIVEAGFLSYEHRGSSADFVFSRNALHQLPDLWKVIALRRIAAMLRPGGVLRLRDLVFDVDPDEIEETIDAWMELAVDDPAKGYTADDFAEHMRSEFSTFTWILEGMLERTGFEIIDRESHLGVYTAYTCRRLGL